MAPRSFERAGCSSFIGLQQGLAHFQVSRPRSQLDEGSLLYMPVTLPNVSINEAKRLIQVQDTIIKSVPEVEHVLGKVGRAETSTDPAHHHPATSFL